MTQDRITQLSQLLDHSVPGAVIKETERLFDLRYEAAGFAVIADTYGLITDLFSGSLPGYRACNCEYHTLGHTLDVLMATSRLIDGYNLSHDALPQGLAVDLHLAALLHDTGYIQDAQDREGTGAKHTKTHVNRSVVFSLKHADMLKIEPERARLISRLISCTNIDPMDVQPVFEEETQEIAGAILGTADLLGQMADRAYLEKLLFLYHELREAGFAEYKTEFDILEKTLGFYTAVRARLEGRLLRMYLCATPHFQVRFGVSRNLYMESVENQMQYLRSIIADDTTNFRKKLKRLDVEKIEPGRAARPA
jgi:hypothetical protein